MGAEFFFDAVAIRPGKPAVFGRCRNTLVFGLPGNPVSTMVTFQLFVIPALDVLSGTEPRPLPLLEATLAEPLQENPSLTHFLPARLEWPSSVAPTSSRLSGEVRPLRWQGSGDIAALTHANCFLVVPPERSQISAGEKVSILPRLDVL
jgi:molybdopterin molybdotransferase